jgi:hypothetical protein
LVEHALNGAADVGLVGWRGHQLDGYGKRHRKSKGGG